MKFFVSFCVLALCYSFTNKAIAQTPSPLNATPVVLSGAIFKSTNLIPVVNKYKAGDVVGFVYDPTQPSKWVQVPIQVDERDTVDAGKIYHTNSYLDPWTESIYGTGRTADYSLLRVAQYCDSTTFTGKDHDPSFDGDDELSFMLRDLGKLSAPINTRFPAGVDSTTGVESVVYNPITRKNNYVYFFDRSPGGGLTQSAGKSYITDYQFNFTKSGVVYDRTGYTANYNTQTGPNYETSFVKTPYYQRDFADRYIDKTLIINSADSKGINIYDRHAFGEATGSCARSEYTFSGHDILGYPTLACNSGDVPTSEGSFIANIKGPIRAIRSYFGANSAPLNQRTCVYYDMQENVFSYVRVHPIDGIADFYDYNKDAGVMYYNNNNNNPATQPNMAANADGQKGILIDGKPDPEWKNGPLAWELVNSTSGSVFRYKSVITDLTVYKEGATTPQYYPQSYYLDDVDAQLHGVCQCTGDASAWGASGSVLRPRPLPIGNALFPYTDPRYTGGPVYKMTGIEQDVYLPSKALQSDTTAWLSLFIYQLNPQATTIDNWPKPYHPTSADPIISIFPNPSKGIISLKAIGLDNQPITAVFYNSVGKQIYSLTGVGFVDTKVNLQAQNSEFYIVKVTVGGKSSSRKILVTR